MTKTTKDDKPRNWVHKAVQELGLKPSKHRDRKHDYDRAHRRRAERDWESEDSEVLRPRRTGKPKKHSRTSQDWSGDSEGELAYFPWLEPDQDPSTTSEV